MFFNIDVDIYDEITDLVDVAEAKPLLLRYFDLLPEEDDHDKELGEELLRLFKAEYGEIEEMMMMTQIGYSTLILTSRTLTPEFWTTQNVKLLRIRHAPLIRRICE